LISELPVSGLSNQRDCVRLPVVGLCAAADRSVVGGSCWTNKIADEGLKGGGVRDSEGAAVGVEGGRDGSPRPY
jgi:hypothetical protein